MKSSLLRIAVILCFHHMNAKILRNNALMSRMVSSFRNNPGREPDQPEPTETQETAQPKVMGLMQNVLCKNFPSVPCDMIVGDKTLNDLIGRSIQQLKYKKLTLEKTTPLPIHQLTLFPSVNSEELSNYLAVKNTGYFESEKKKKKPPYPVTPKATYWPTDENKKVHKSFKAKRTALFSRLKSNRKFYPHKVKYKDKNAVHTGKDFGDYSEEKLSMSVEVPDMTLTKKHQHFSYKREPENPPVWRIDYAKHGDPILSHFNFEDQMKGKMVKIAPNLDDNVVERARKDVMHPDMYIKKNLRKSLDVNSEGMD